MPQTDEEQTDNKTTFNQMIEKCSLRLYVTRDFAMMKNAVLHTNGGFTLRWNHPTAEVAYQYELLCRYVPYDSNPKLVERLTRFNIITEEIGDDDVVVGMRPLLQEDHISNEIAPYQRIRDLDICTRDAVYAFLQTVTQYGEEERALIARPLANELIARMTICN